MYLESWVFFDCILICLIRTSPWGISDYTLLCTTSYAWFINEALRFLKNVIRNKEKQKEVFFKNLCLWRIYSQTRHWWECKLKISVLYISDDRLNFLSAFLRIALRCFISRRRLVAQTYLTLLYMLVFKNVSKTKFGKIIAFFRLSTLGPDHHLSRELQTFPNESERNYQLIYLLFSSFDCYNNRVTVVLGQGFFEKVWTRQQEPMRGHLLHTN